MDMCWNGQGFTSVSTKFWNCSRYMKRCGTTTIAYDSFIEKFQGGTEAVRINKWKAKAFQRLVDTKTKGLEDVDLWPGALLDNSHANENFTKRNNWDPN
jgi:hypothetical protein